MSIEDLFTSTDITELDRAEVEAKIDIWLKPKEQDIPELSRQLAALCSELEHLIDVDISQAGFDAIYDLNSGTDVDKNLVVTTCEYMMLQGLTNITNPVLLCARTARYRDEKLVESVELFMVVYDSIALAPAVVNWLEVQQEMAPSIYADLEEPCVVVKTLQFLDEDGYYPPTECLEIPLSRIELMFKVPIKAADGTWSV